MAFLQKKIWVCLMGFSLISHLGNHHAFASDDQPALNKEYISANFSFNRE